MKRVVILFLLSVPGLLFAQEKNDIRQLYLEGEKAHSEGRYDQAVILLNRCIREDPAFADAYFVRATAREQLKDLAGALTDYSIYLELVPGSAEALLSRGVLRYQMEKYAQAKDDFIQLLKVPLGETNTVIYQKSASPKGTHQIMTAQQAGLRPQVFNYLGLTETKLGNFKDAMMWLDSAITLQPNDADYYVNRGIAKEAMGDTNAATDYKKALALNAHHTMALHNLAVLSRKRGDATYNNDLEKAIESDSSMLYPYLERAYQRLEGGFYKGALEDYNKALSIENKDPEIWLNRGLVKERLNDFKGAYADYTRAIALKEDFDKAWLNRGNVLNKQGKYKEAIEDYTVAITYSADYSAAYYNRAIAKDKIKLSAEACQDLLKAEQLGMKVEEKIKSKICRKD